jgi:hypothetical protein
VEGSIWQRVKAFFRGMAGPRTAAGRLDVATAEQGLKLSNLDGDDHTTEALSERLGIDAAKPEAVEKARRDRRAA